MPGYQITEYCHRMIKEHIKEGDCCVDATAGNGNDTEFLCRLTGADGKVYIRAWRSCFAFAGSEISRIFPTEV